MRFTLKYEIWNSDPKKRESGPWEKEFENRDEALLWVYRQEHPYMYIKILKEEEKKGMRFFNKAEAEEHLICFKNMYECFLTRIPWVTVIVSLLVWGTLAQYVFWFEMVNQDGTHVPWIMEVVFKTAIFTVLALMLFLINEARKDLKGVKIGMGSFSATMKYIGKGMKSLGVWLCVGLWLDIWEEIKDIPNTVRNCMKCGKPK